MRQAARLAGGIHQASPPGNRANTDAEAFGRAWKQLGFQVKKGSKAVTQINIWKHVSRKEEIEVKYTDGTTGTEEVDNSKMFMKLSSFFSLSQVERIQTA